MQKALSTIKTLYFYYKDYPEVQEKIVNEIINTLPIQAECWKLEHEKSSINTEINLFIESFFEDKIQYFYYEKENLFFQYDGLNYSFIHEDDLLYKILSKISEKKNLLEKKQMIKDEIMKKIRNNDIFKSIPESQTIQKIINYFYPIFFKTKSETKYLLTILGDNILKKTTNKLHLVYAKLFIDYIGDIYNDIFKNKNIISSFIFDINKVNSIDADKYRVVDTKKDVDNPTIWRFFLDQNLLNLIIVSVHYSQRYDNSEKYLSSKIEDTSKIFILHNYSGDSFKIIDYFNHKFINKVNDKKENIISFQELYYLWCFSFKENNIPNLFTFSLFEEKMEQYYKKQKLFKKINNNNTTKKYLINATNERVNILRKVLWFWENNIIQDKTEELEISELFLFFKKATGIKTTNERELLNIVEHFYRNVSVKNNTLVGIKIKNWSKKQSVYESLCSIFNITHDKKKILLLKMKTISTLEIYRKYCKYLKKTNKQDIIVSKSYFINCLLELKL